jgi:hypothetical protein
VRGADLDLVGPCRWAKESANFDQLEYARQAELVATGWTPREVFDRAGTDVRVAHQHVVRPFTPTSLALSPGAD